VPKKKGSIGPLSRVSPARVQHGSLILSASVVKLGLGHFSFKPATRI